MTNFVGFNLKARPGESVQVYTEGDEVALQELLSAKTEKGLNAIQTLLKKGDQVAVIQRDASRGGGVIGIRVVRRKR